MKFFHVYNEDSFKGLEKNGLINRDTGFKIQHCFAVPEQRLFNGYAARGTRLYEMIKADKIPFYVDRIAGGITWYPYEFDKALINDYRQMLGDWFMGFQLHESGSNFRKNDWARLRIHGDGPYDIEMLDREYYCSELGTLGGKRLHRFAHEGIEYFASRKYAVTYREFLTEFKELFERRMAETENCIIPCDSFYLAAKLQHEVGMRTFMPEVGSQIPLMRVAVASARGMASATGKTWGTYYECWRKTPGYGYTMPCFNSDLSNEWYLTQQTHADDFTTHGKNGGSSRLLQNRIYYYTLMAGADYMSEEWGLNCSYSDMNTFELSDYGLLKKNFINNALNYRGVKARVPFAIVMPVEYACVEINRDILNSRIGDHSGTYLNSELSETEKDYFGHIEDIIKLIFAYELDKRFENDNEDHVLTNTRFGDVFDIIFEDSSDETFSRYDYLIDASKDGDFAKKMNGRGFKIVESGDIFALEAKLPELIKETMPCYVDGLHWLVSYDEAGNRYLTIFNNAGNERDIKRGDVIIREADRVVTVTFKEASELKTLVEGENMPTEIQRIDEKTYNINVPATSFVVLSF